MTIYQNLIAGSGFLQGPTGPTGPAANTNITIYEYVATAGQTTFTGVDSKLQTLTYTPTGIFVTLNGSVLNDVVDFTATNGTSIVLTQAAAVNDELNIYTFPAFNVSGTYTQAEVNALLAAKLNLTGGTITGNVSFANGTSLLIPVGNTAQRPAVSPGQIRYNTDLNTLESANATAWANVGSGSASSGGGVSWTPSVQNTGFIAVKNSGYLVNTATGNVTVTLPASPTIGDNITFVDYGGTFSANGLIFYPNGNKINANTINVALTTSTASIGLVYTDANKGWVAYNGFQSSPIGNYSIEYLVVAGGGGGSAGYASGAGGAGGMLTGTTPIVAGTSYSVTIGSGGTAVSGSGSGAGWPNARGSAGGTSSFASLNAVGGGGGAGNSWTGATGGNGGSGGGGAQSYSGGSGTPGQGYPGGAGASSPSYGGGGGGGAGGSGSDGTTSNGGNGGIGATSSISGTSTYYAGGGGGGTYYYQQGNAGNGPPGTGGTGGGGPGGKYSGGLQPGTNGTTNLGGGGGGGAGFDSPSQSWAGGNGGSGIVILRYLGPQRASGGAITISGGYTTHTFIGSGTFTA